VSNVIVLEVNELNIDVVTRMVDAGRLPNFKRLIAANQLVFTTTDEEYSKLEPWIQWVTVHTGKTQQEHGAFNLSDGQCTNLRQSWDLLAEQGVKCGVVSPMNARCGDFKNGFFIPDPWSTAGDTYPKQLAPIYGFLTERVQSHNVSLEAGSSKVSFALELLRAGIPLRAVVDIATAYVRSRFDPKRKWRLAAELDRFLWRLTKTLRRKFGTQYTSLFLNSVAHYQHHYWTSHDAAHWSARYPRLFACANPVSEENLHPEDDPIAYGMEIYDGILGEAIDEVGVNRVSVITGLSQVPFEGYAGDSGFYLYRPLDHEAMLADVGVQCAQVAPLMSRDMMLFFADDTQRQRALTLLNSASIQGHALFECTLESENRLFCKVQFSSHVEPGAMVVFQDASKKPLRFSDYFKLITFKTGHHHAEGFVIAPKFALKGIEANGRMPLVKLPEVIFRMVGKGEAASLASNLQSSTPSGSAPIKQAHRRPALSGQL